MGSEKMSHAYYSITPKGNCKTDLIYFQYYNRVKRSIYVSPVRLHIVKCNTHTILGWPQPASVSVVQSFYGCSRSLLPQRRSNHLWTTYLSPEQNNTKRRQDYTSRIYNKTIHNFSTNMCMIPTISFEMLWALDLLLFLIASYCMNLLNSTFIINSLKENKRSINTSI